MIVLFDRNHRLGFSDISESSCGAMSLDENCLQSDAQRTIGDRKTVYEMLVSYGSSGMFDILVINHPHENANKVSSSDLPR